MICHCKRSEAIQSYFKSLDFLRVWIASMLTLLAMTRGVIEQLRLQRLPYPPFAAIFSISVIASSEWA